MGFFDDVKENPVLEIDENQFMKLSMKQQNLIIFKNVSGYRKQKSYLQVQGWVLGFLSSAVLYLFSKIK